MQGVAFLERLVLQLRGGRVKEACEDARAERAHDPGLLCAPGLVLRLQAEVESQLSAERARPRHHVDELDVCSGMCSRVDCDPAALRKATEAGS